jgi:hypothetical protein
LTARHVQAQEIQPGVITKDARQRATLASNYLRNYAMSAEVIDLQSYRRKKEEERRSKSVRDLKARNYSEDYTFGPDDLPENFGSVSEIDVLKMMGLKPGDVLDEQD